jgi:hypothetical protein
MKDAGELNQDQMAYSHIFNFFTIVINLCRYCTTHYIRHFLGQYYGYGVLETLRRCHMY